MIYCGKNNSISVSTEVFVRELMGDVLCEDKRLKRQSSSLCEEDGCFYRAVHEQKPMLTPILEEILELSSDAQHACFSLLKDIVDNYTARAGEVFPKTAQSLPNLELQFIAMRHQDKQMFLSCGGVRLVKVCWL